MYIHIILGTIDLLIRYSQFNQKFGKNHLKLHQFIVKLYVVSAIISSISGVYIAFFETGGIIASTGFICLGIVWFFSTYLAYIKIKKNLISEHQKLMTYSYE